MGKDYKIMLSDGSCLDFKQVFHQYFHSLVFFVDRYLEEEEESKSIVQDAFLALWEKHLEFSDELSVRVYLYSCVRHKALDVLKHRKVEQRYASEILQDEAAESYYMESVIEEETRRLISAAIDSLPENCRKVCLLILDGLDNQEIANELKISLNTVKFHKKNAYKLLREKLKDQFYLIFLL
ncbi:RNA polymerase sigma-70 factor [Butyricimonas synergistica]|uniref:RNA polymerase sigma-70 factor n=1 Tax=Butyricimonas synergistica TaxID=544644 RepID=UPI00036F0FE9|nr:RNA polymerase sigma-70 factor [Butyricimonas synergistica]